MTGLELKGLVTVKDGIAYIDQNPLVEALEQFNGRYAELKLAFPEDVRWEIDEGIKPLIEVIRDIGWRTLSSCEGHEENPYVSFIYEPRPVQASISDVAKYSGWHFENYGGKVWRLQANVKKTREEIVEFANKIREAFSAPAR